MSSSEDVIKTTSSDNHITNSENKDNDLLSEEITLTKDDLEELLNESKSNKEKGNILFKDEKYDDAIIQYEEALNICPNEYKMDRSIYYANIAACYFNQEKWKECIDMCTKALKENPNYLKALYRRAQANEKLESWISLDSALRDYRDLEIARNPPAPAYMKLTIDKALKTLPTKIEIVKEREKAEMLGKLKDLGNTVLGKFGLSTDNFNFVKDPNSGSYSVNFNQKK